jgi:undecaprenyl-diphosphatase
MLFDLLKAASLGIVEGLTEFLPVSSTGHLLLMEHFFGFDDDAFGKSFAVLIQLGAILALLSIYFTRLWKLATGFFSNPQGRRFIVGVLLAFLPSAIVGALRKYCSTSGSSASCWCWAASCCSGSTA